MFFELRFVLIIDVFVFLYNFGFCVVKSIGDVVFFESVLVVFLEFFFILFC